MAELTTATLTVPDGTEDEVLQITGSSANSYRLAGLAITTGEPYTFSVWIRAAAAMTVEFRVLGYLFTVSATTAWQKVVFTVGEASTDYIDISPASDSALYLYKGMLQKGQFDTDWKPAPEDTESALAEVQEKASRKNTVYYSAAQPTGDLAEGDIWFSTSDGGIYYYDGTSWVAHKVGTVSIADGIVTADAIIASGVFAKTIYAEGLHLEGEGGAFLQFYDNGILLAGGVDISDAILRSGTLAGEFEIVSDMLGSIRFDADAFVLDFSDATGNPLCIYGGDIAFSSDSHGIKADTTGSTSTASSSGWLLRGHPVSNTYCCCLGNTSDNTRLYGANLYRSGTSTSISSDRRMKKDFTDLDQRYDSFFKALKPCQFRFLDNTSGRLHTGFIAQEVETALEKAGIDTKDFAGLVIDSIDEDALAEQGINVNSGEWADKKQYYLRYEEFIALNTCMIQKLQARVEELERCSLPFKISKIAHKIRKGWDKMKKMITALALALCLLATTATAVFRAEPQTTKQAAYTANALALDTARETSGNAVLEDADSSVPDEENEPEPEEADTPDEPVPDVEEDDIPNEEKIRANLDPDSDVFYADVVCPGHIWEDGGPRDTEKPELGWCKFCLICGKTVNCDPPAEELDEAEPIYETSGNARQEEDE